MCVSTFACCEHKRVGVSPEKAPQGRESGPWGSADPGDAPALGVSVSAQDTWQG